MCTSNIYHSETGLLILAKVIGITGNSDAFSRSFSQHMLTSSFGSLLNCPSLQLISSSVVPPVESNVSSQPNVWWFQVTSNDRQLVYQVHLVPIFRTAHDATIENLHFGSSVESEYLGIGRKQYKRSNNVPWTATRISDSRLCQSGYQLRFDPVAIFGCPTCFEWR